MSDAPPGWYPDPAAVGVTPPPLRYWDGVRWTEHLSYPAAAPTGPTTPDGARLAGWWHRVGATLIDGIFGAIVSVVCTIPSQLRIQRQSRALADELQRRIDAGRSGNLSWYFHQFAHIYRQQIGWEAIPLVVVAGGMTLFLHLRGGSPGQLLTGLRVRLRERPGNLSWGRALARVVLYQCLAGAALVLGIVSGSIALAVLGYLIALVWSLLDPLWAAWDSRRQTLHDKIVRTNVVRVR